jgi:ferritin
MKHKDHATYNFLQWFIDEQVEEESNVKDIITKLKLVGKDGQGILIVDNELGQRVFVNTTGLNPEDSL